MVKNIQTIIFLSILIHLTIYMNGKKYLADNFWKLKNKNINFNIEWEVVKN